MSRSSKSMRPTVPAGGNDRQKEQVADGVNKHGESFFRPARTRRCSYYVSTSGLSKPLRCVWSGCWIFRRQMSTSKRAAEHIDPRGLRRYVVGKVRIFDPLRGFMGRPQVLEEPYRSEERRVGK